MVLLGSDQAIRRDLELATHHRSSVALRPLQARVPSASPAPSRVAAAAPPARPAVQGGGQQATVSLKEIARQAAREAEREVILKTLQQTRWNRRKAAGRLGISYKALLYKIKEAITHRV